MVTDGPGRDPWTVAIYASGSRFPVGSGVLIDRRRVLTCLHVLQDRRQPFTVAYPKSGLPRTAMTAVAGFRPGREGDVAVLELADLAPPEAVPAPLRSPTPDSLAGERWWAFGFTQDSELGTDAYGVIGAPLAYGWVRLDTQSRYVVKPGFSGAGLWSAAFGAVVGLVGQARLGGDHPGDALAVTLHRAAAELPDEKLHELSAWSIMAAGETALKAWGWSLSHDVEAVRHWRPRARGVSIDTEGGYRFRGRTAALTTIVGWLGRARPDARVLVVTGSPGVGKSAVLGRVVTTADKGMRAALPATDRNVRAPLGSIACAVHAKGKTALDVATEIAKAASIRVPRTVDELVPALHQKLNQEGGRRRFNLVIDALDEASSPRQARLIMNVLLLPIARTCARLGAQVVVGSRLTDDGGPLLTLLGANAELVNLDEERYFAEEDLIEYAHATLALTGDERSDNPYADPEVAVPVARQIASMADRNFLIAGLIARSHGLYDTEPVDPAGLDFTATVDAALEDYLIRLPPLDQVPATVVLTALAYAQAPGLSVDLWRVALEALNVAVGRDELVRFAGSSAANFLVESSNDAGTPRYRLFHQALNDSLLARRTHDGLRRDDERALALRLIQDGRTLGWERVDPYLLRVLPTYAGRAGIIDTLLTDDTFLLYADLPRLTQLADQARTAAGYARARLLRLTPHAIAAGARERAALFGVTESLEQLGDTFSSWAGLPYQARWATVTGRAERAVLEGHAGAVRGICEITVAGQPHLATVGDFRSVRFWNPASGRHWEVPIPQTQTEPQLAVCPVVLGGRVVAAVAGRSRRISFIDPVARRFIGALPESPAIVRSLCTVNVEGQSTLVSGGDDGVIRMWSLANRRLRTIAGHDGPVRCVTVIRRRGRELLLSAGDDYKARVWDPLTGQQMLVVAPHIAAVRAACSVTVGGRASMATANYRTAKVWNAATGLESYELDGHTAGIRGMVALRVDGKEVLATAAADGDVRIWDPEDGSCLRVLSGHTDAVTAICTITVDGRAFVATTSLDRTARQWDVSLAGPATGGHHRGTRVSGACMVRASARQLVATVDNTTGVIRLQNVETGAEVVQLKGVTGAFADICTVDYRARQLVVASSDQGTLQIWDPGAGRQLHYQAFQYGSLRAMCSFEARGGRPVLAVVSKGHSAIRYLWADTAKFVHSVRMPNFFGHRKLSAHLDGVRIIRHLVVDGVSLLATAGDDDEVVLWGPEGRPRNKLVGHRRSISALTTVAHQGRTLLATAGADQTVRLWDPAGGDCLAVMTGHTDGINALCPVTVDGRRMLASGSQDRTIKIWDVGIRSLHLSIPVHHPALVCLEVSDGLFVGLTAGSLVLGVGGEGEEFAPFQRLGAY
ncbi:trypsin-like peptidase domain-containing protein [Actinoplanes sp. NPDC004185]